MTYNPNNPNGQATSANSAPVTVANDQLAAGQTLATSALQTSGNNTLTTIVTNTGRLPSPGAATTSASLPVTIASDQTVPIANGFVNLTANSISAVNGDLIPQTDVSAYKWASLNIVTGTFSGTYTFQGTNEATPTNWVSIPALPRTVGQPASTTTGSGTGIIYDIPLSFRWLRVRVTAYTSGTVVGVGSLYATMTQMMSTTAFVTQSGTWNVNAILTPSAGSQGLTSFLNTALTALTVVKASAGRVHRIIVQNPNTSLVWLQVFNSAITGAVTLGTTQPLYSIPILASGVFEDFFDHSDTFSAGITVAATTTATGATAVGTGLYVSLGVL